MRAARGLAGGGSGPENVVRRGRAGQGRRTSAGSGTGDGRGRPGRRGGLCRTALWGRGRLGPTGRPGRSGRSWTRRGWLTLVPGNRFRDGIRTGEGRRGQRRSVGRRPPDLGRRSSSSNPLLQGSSTDSTSAPGDAKASSAGGGGGSGSSRELNSGLGLDSLLGMQGQASSSSSRTPPRGRRD